MSRHHSVSTADHDAGRLAQAVADFVRGSIVPREACLRQDSGAARDALAELARAARREGLWGLFHPAGLGGRLASLDAYLAVAEQEGYSEYGPAIFGARATLDLHMLNDHGSTRLRERWLAPLARGVALGAYAMTEPDTPGSVPAMLNTRAEPCHDRWRINGRKWFISRATEAAFVIVVARTDPAGPPERAFSLFVVPVDTPGFSLDREIGVLGGARGHGELRFDDVEVPAWSLLGEPGNGLASMHERLALGRTLNAAHWLGLARRCYDLMGERIWSPRGVDARLAEKQLVRMQVYEVHQALALALAQLRAAATERGVLAVNLAKLAASRALNLAVDTAMQLHGAEGVSDATPLASIFGLARTTRILDGADEVLVSSCGRQLLQASRPRATEDA